MRTRILTAVAVAVAIGVALDRLPTTVRSLDNRAAAGARLSGVDRELPGAVQYDVPTAALVRLATLLPRNAVYTFVPPANGANLSQLAFPGLAADYLLPRRDAGNAGGAAYVIAYQEPLPRGKVSKVVDVGDGVLLGVLR